MKFGVGLSIPERAVAGQGGSSFSPLSLSPLAWARSRISTLYQDSAGTTPVTGAGQDVGAVDDQGSVGGLWSQVTATARPTYEIGPARRVYDPDDALNVTLPAISGGQIVIISPVGTWIDSLDFAGGTFTVGPDTYTGGPLGLMATLGNAEIEIIILPTPMTEAERAKMVSYAQGLGSAGLVTFGANKTPAGDFESGLIGIKTDGDGSVSTWTLNTSSPISGTQDGLLDVTVNDNNRPFLRFELDLDSPLDMGKRYILTVDTKPVSGTPSLWGYAVGDAAVALPAATPIPTGRISFIGSVTTTQLIAVYFSNLSATYSVQLDNVEVREVIMP